MEAYRELILELAERRKELGLSQEALSFRIGCATSLIHKWETHKRTPSAFLFTCWLDALGCKIEISTKDSEQSDLSM